jgi:hypothetical protein
LGTAGFAEAAAEGSVAGGAGGRAPWLQATGRTSAAAAKAVARKARVGVAVARMPLIVRGKTGTGNRLFHAHE